MSQNISEKSEMLNELDWIQIRNEFYENDNVETFKEKIIRKTVENPTVPIGVLATVSALCYGLWNFSTGNAKMSQYMMRARVGAQAFTIFSVVVGFLISTRNQES
ncbi:PREDICTED: HIG1 domain family member 2A, mitochondrial [Dufourea novaeangliae]|uniref:HIG1 domain family member 2A n=1 Tax=Dufourea novaeangliae TaxID=178035 RepID=A0A154P4F3_DUFNO|nr:PREDICTED: HIG1 domain family member 2A, mitochondrial [Dufourea novaeangliae]XP_015439430.1 PREDICTED: HIG1 domain family member 2A, mitochondrial [Dufourea novaeangliae]KZC06000.1 HIG1 domain family member 2A [Dufourea novaeangliae]